MLFVTRAYSSVAGRRGRAQRLGRLWVGWADHVAHPDAPLGGGGLGRFSRHSLQPRKNQQRAS